jgi:hypothetical protein
VKGEAETMTDATGEAPHGCLGCNLEKMEAFFKAQGLPTDRFTEVPRPRHAWGDIICCPDCGRAWLVTPAIPAARNE